MDDRRVARALGRQARIPTTRPERRACSSATAASRRAASLSASTRWGRSASAPTSAAAGRTAADPNGTAPPTAVATVSATWSAHSTCTPTTCGRGCVPLATATRRLSSCARSGSPISARRGSTGSRTTSPATGRRRSAPGQPTTTSSSCRPRPTPATLNRIESHFGAISEFVVKNADYPDWDSFALATSKHISYRNHPQRRRERLERAQKRLRLAA